MEDTMQTYRINAQMLGGEATESDARRMVELLTALGYDVEYTTDCGDINARYDEDYIPDYAWTECMAAISRTA